MKLLNVGCGATYHTAWVNLDVEPLSRDVLRHHAASPLPFEDCSFDACYSSHLIEHLSPVDARLLLKEMHRVLKPGGIIRVVVPDLESIVRLYLAALEEVRNTGAEAQARYDWAVLELLDQMVRSSSEGEMGDFLRNCPAHARQFVKSRIGAEADRIWGDRPVAGERTTKLCISAGWLVARVRFWLICCCAWLFGGNRGLRAVKEGWFRSSGETHRWMYDRFSLGRLLQDADFEDVVVCAPDASLIPGFASYGLDVVHDMVRKPDSLFMEGVRR